MKKQKVAFTWHYYAMAIGVLMAMLAATLSAWGSVVSALAFAVLSHPVLSFQGVTRFVFLILFFILYIFAFPDASVVQEMMATDISNA
uniref:Uncharacterized protein n=1 Tax=Hydrogenovibrio crunogenus (strain DSM 25203 / XCL-2) TaxID=317025 RepID=Q31H74_HYDCU